ncbi:MAG: hypothetical protein ACWIPI_07645, partial [Polaribacter sp.]
AFSWYLDIVADNWDVLLWNDYEAVMPIPWKQKYFLKYVSQPPFCQQLGIFSKEIISEELQEKMIKHIPRKFVKISLNFNSANFLTRKTIKRKNYILEISTSFEENYKKFNNNRKRVLKKTENSSIYTSEVTFDNLLLIVRKYYSHLSYSDLDYRKLNTLTVNLKKEKKCFLVGVYNKRHHLIGGVLFLKDTNRITYLFSVMTDEGKKLNGASFLIYFILKEFSNKGYILDFEGSMHVGIADFFKSFGAKIEPYYQYTRVL